MIKSPENAMNVREDFGESNVPKIVQLHVSMVNVIK